MKKVILFLMVIALSVFTLSAQVVKPASIEWSTTNGLFNNALDAAATIDESVTDLDFSTLGKDYLFAGIAGNPQKIANNGSNSTRLLLGYYKAAEKPWSIFTTIAWSGTNLSSISSYKSGDGTETRKYFNPLFRNFNPSATFLMNLGNISTGVGLDVNLTDNKAGGSTTNYEYNDTENDINRVNKTKDFTTDINLSVPFFTQTNNVSHYAALNVGMFFVDNGALSFFSTAGTTITDTKKTDLYTTISPSVFYKLSMPTEKLGTFYGSGEIGLTTKSYKNENVNEVAETKSSDKKSYAPGFNTTLAAGLRMEQSTDGDWLRFRLNPEATYSFKSKSYETGYTSSSTSGGTTTTETHVGGKGQNISNSLTLSLKSAMEVKPEKWIVGLMLGAEGNVGFTNTTQTNREAKPSDQEADKPTNKTVKNNWTALTSANFGIFIPLPNDYRFDVCLNGSNALVFDSLTMQLIVPLGKTTGF